MGKWYGSVKEAIARVRGKEATSLPDKDIRGQHHIESRALKTNKIINVCAFCMFSFRDQQGNVKCGNGFSGFTEEVIPKPFEHSCRKWKLRRKEQPPIYFKKDWNRAVARYARMVDGIGRTDLQRRGIR
jgi:hypothetical protein